jgi:CHAD domain-containing protein
MLSDGLKRVVEQQLRFLADRLRKGKDLEEEIHEARKGLKRVRALLRLVKHDLGAAYSEENRRLRDLGRRFSEMRDAHATLEAFDEFAKKRRLVRKLAAVRAELVRKQLELEQGADWAQVMKQASDEVAAVAKRVENWPQSMEPNLQSGYRRARVAFEAAQDGGKADQFHELRKRTKAHLYQLRILSGGGCKQRLTALKELSDCLGRQHNFVVLADKLPQSGDLAALAMETRERIARERLRLEKQALGLAEKVYGQKPKAFIREFAGAEKKPLGVAGFKEAHSAVA